MKVSLVTQSLSAYQTRTAYAVPYSNRGGMPERDAPKPKQYADHDPANGVYLTAIERRCDDILSGDLYLAATPDGQTSDAA